MNFKKLKPINRIIEERAMELGDKVCLSFENEKNISYRELDIITSKIANGMMELGVSKSDNVAVLLPNSLGKEATPELVKAAKPDVVIL